MLLDLFVVLGVLFAVVFLACLAALWAFFSRRR